MKMILEIEAPDNLGIGKYGLLVNLIKNLGLELKKTKTIRKYKFKEFGDDLLNICGGNVNSSLCSPKSV